MERMIKWGTHKKALRKAEERAFAAGKQLGAEEVQEKLHAILGVDKIVNKLENLIDLSQQ